MGQKEEGLYIFMSTVPCLSVIDSSLAAELIFSVSGADTSTSGPFAAHFTSEAFCRNFRSLDCVNDGFSSRCTCSCTGGNSVRLKRV